MRPNVDMQWGSIPTSRIACRVASNTFFSSAATGMFSPWHIDPPPHASSLCRQSSIVLLHRELHAECGFDWDPGILVRTYKTYSSGNKTITCTFCFTPFGSVSRYSASWESSPWLMLVCSLSRFVIHQRTLKTSSVSLSIWKTKVFMMPNPNPFRIDLETFPGRPSIQSHVRTLRSDRFRGFCRGMRRSRFFSHQLL